MQKKYHLEDQLIPDGFRIFEDRLSVMGVVNRARDCAAFCRGREQKLRFVPEPTNPYDKNAIAIHGAWKGAFFRGSAHLGYVSKEVASQIAAKSLTHAIEPRLLKTYVGDDGYAEILFQILGPSDKYTEYKPPAVKQMDLARQLSSAGQDADAEMLLLSMVEKEEREGKYGVRAIPYKDLAAFYKSQKRSEDAWLVLKRFAAQKISPGRNQEALFARYEKEKQKRGL